MKYGKGGLVANTAEEFWDKVDCRGADDCWPWKEATFSNGYGRFKTNYKSVRAHRYALALSKGDALSAELLALHSCHNRKCCNPKHLRWGTHAENMQDRTARRQMSVAEYEKSWDHVPRD